MSVTFSTHCHAGDRDKLYSNLNTMTKSHGYEFDEYHIAHQRCGRGIFNIFYQYKPITLSEIKEEDYDRLLEKFGLPIEDKEADRLTHGKNSAHYWKNHIVNHLSGVENCNTDYIVFSDSDCVMVRNEPRSWIEEGIKILQSYPSVFIVSPSDGAPGRQWIASQQLFLCETNKLKTMDFNCWDGVPIDGGPMIEFYFMLEGRISMFMREHGLCRVVLPDNWRYHHDWIHHPETYGYDLPEGLV